MQVRLNLGRVQLDGILELPPGAKSVVVFAHGSGSSRLSPRNNYVALVLREAGLGTLLFDLLTSEEDRDYENRFNIDLLAERLAAATGWLLGQAADLVSLGYFGASTGAAAALQASVERPEVRAIVSRGGRPDLAADCLGSIKAPTLLVVGGRDEEVLMLNRQALARIPAEKDLIVVPGATHLFEEPGALEEVTRAAASWFGRFLE
jgi:pimeloyl-ACP methyl ester carboxylesterase